MKSRIRRNLDLILFVAMLSGSLVILGGCSTVSGFSSFVGGIARDIGDAAEGTRSKMHENGPHR